MEDLVEQRLTEHAATFTPGELRATVLEQSTGRLAPEKALRLAKQMTESRAVIPLEGGRMTTLKLRAREQHVERKLLGLAAPAGRDLGERARTHAADRVAERIGVRLTGELPTVELAEIKRTSNPAEQRAWADLRAGRSERAMAHYRAQGRLHIHDTREQAIERAVQTWGRLTREHDSSQALLISDASNVEIDRINARAQHLLAQQGRLGTREQPIPGTHYGIRIGDRVTLTDHRETGRPRVENGSRGYVLDITTDAQATILFDITGDARTLQGDQLASVRLAYAQHIHRAQGATVEHALVVTGSWQANRETAYVQATRARNATSWFVGRDDLGTDGQDADRIARLAQRMRHSRAQTPSLARSPAEPGRHDHALHQGLRPHPLGYLHRLTGHSRHSSLPLPGENDPWQAPSRAIRGRGRDRDTGIDIGR